MKGVAIILLCAVSLAQADRRQVSRSGQPCECNSNDAKSFCANKANEGALTSHENCNLFYKCSHGQAVPYFCPSQLVFNPITKQCDWFLNVDCGSRPVIDESEANCESEEQEVERPEQETNCDPAEAPRICAVENSDGVLVAHENCNQFYKCAHGVPVPLNCWGNLLYNPYKGECDWPENVECDDRHITDIDNGGSNGGNGGTGTCNCNPGEAPGICAAPGSNGILIAHEKCNKFYKCDHGTPIAMKCNFGLLYNPFTEQCDWPYNVNCDDRLIPETDNGGADNDKSEEENGGTCNCNPGEAPGICAAPGSNGILIAHENCNQFYKCDHGAPVTFSCNNGLLYNPFTEQCDWSHNVNCGDRPITETDNGGDENDKSEEDNSGTCNCNPGEAPGICAAPGSNGILIAHEKCNKFYKCDHGTPIAMKCNFGLLYNPFTEKCDWPHNVNCDDRPIPETDNGSDENDKSEEDNSGTCNCNPGEAPGICAAPGSNGILIAHENCNQFYKCDHGAPVTFSCNNGLLYNPFTEQCDWSHNVNCGDRPITETDNGGDENDKSEEDNSGTCNCNPGEAPGICAAPGSNGILIAHENCNQFYKCDHGAPVTFSCNNGLLYNPFTEQCDWSHNVNCGDRPITETDNGGDENDKSEEDNSGTCNCNPGEAPGICAAPGSNGILIAHENCNQFYKCDHGAPVTFSCQTGLLYNPFTEQCDWSHNVNCGDRPITETDNGGNENDKSEEDNGSTCNCNPGEAPGICAAPGSNGILIAHENCNQFYKCDHGAPVTFSCQTGLLYNPFTEQCDWPHNVNCGERPIPETDNGGNENDKSEEDNGGTCNCNPGEAPGICAAPGSNGILIAHENCNQFYKCDHGAPVTFSCQTGLLYNPFTEQCDWPHNVNCGDRPIPDTDNGGNENDKSEEDNGGTCNCNPGEAPGICAAPGSNGILIAHEKCNKFYKCDHGTPIAMKCNFGLLYNPFTEQCDWPHNVNCDDRLIPETDNGGADNDKSEEENGGTCNCNPGEAPGICAAPGSNGILIAHENCNQFYKCAHGIPVALNCNAGLLYNPYTERCDWPDNVNCGDRHVSEIDNGSSESEGTCNCNPRKAPGICAAPGSDGILIAHEECNKFYQCSYGKPVAFTCQAELLYNPHTESCDWPHNVNCGDRPVPETDNGGNESEEENGGCNCNPGEAPGICAAPESNGILIAHEKCNKFYKCSDGKPVALNCQAGLLYNPHTESCDWPHNVNCGDRPVPETDNGGNESEEENGGCNCNPGEAPGICAAPGSNGILIAHEKCNKFYKCSDGKPVALNCQAGLLYNPHTESCDWPHNVNCGDRPVPETDNGGNESEEENGGCNCNPGEAPGICAAPGSNGILIAHEKCNKFYKCSDGKPVALNCQAGLLYNPHNESCDWPHNVNCGDRRVAFNKHAPRQGNV